MAALELTPDEWDVVKHNMAFVYSLAKRMRLSWHDSQDACQDGVIGLARGVVNCDAQKGCLTTIADRHVRVHMQRGRRRDRPIHVPEHIWFRPGHPLYPLAERAISATFDPVDEKVHGVAAPVDQVELAETLAALRDAVESLSDRDRAILEGRMQGKTYREIGEELGMSRQRVTLAERWAHKALREMLADYA